jgi:hypothetical protein
MRMFIRVMEILGMTGASQKHGEGVAVLRKNIDRLNIIPLTIRLSR